MLHAKARLTLDRRLRRLDTRGGGGRCGRDRSPRRGSRDRACASTRNLPRRSGRSTHRCHGSRAPPAARHPRPRDSEKSPRKVVEDAMIRRGRSGGRASRASSTRWAVSIRAAFPGRCRRGHPSERRRGGLIRRPTSVPRSRPFVSAVCAEENAGLASGWTWDRCLRSRHRRRRCSRHGRLSRLGCPLMPARPILAASALLVGRSSPPAPPILCRCESRRYLFVPSMIEVWKDHAGKHRADRFLDREQAASSPLARRR